jgi:hypothetical protein
VPLLIEQERGYQKRLGVFLSKSLWREAWRREKCREIDQHFDLLGALLGQCSNTPTPSAMADKDNRLDFTIKKIVQALKNELMGDSGEGGRILPMTGEIGGEYAMSSLL